MIIKCNHIEAEAQANLYNIIFIIIMKRNFQSGNPQSVEQLNVEPQHLINTTKVLRGAKLRTKDYIRLQLMRLRYCSSVKYQDIVEKNLIEMSKTTQYSEKYRALETIEDQQSLHRRITGQRERQSMEVVNRIKMFTHSGSSTREQSLRNKPNLSLKQKPATSQETRKKYRGKSTNVSFEQTKELIVNGKTNTKKQLQFRSDNIGKKMNDHLNHLFLDSKKTEQHHITKSTQLSAGKDKDDRLPSQAFSPTKGLNYVRLVKKYHRPSRELPQKPEVPVQDVGHLLKEFEEYNKRPCFSVLVSSDAWKNELKGHRSIQIRSGNQDAIQNQDHFPRRFPFFDWKEEH